MSEALGGARLDEFIPGIPAARGKGTPSPREAAWRAALSSRFATTSPLEGPHEYHVEAHFILPRDRAEEMNPDAVHGADLDNLSKVLLDALKAVLPAGDGAITSLHVSKRRAADGETAGAHVRVR